MKEAKPLFINLKWQSILVFAAFLSIALYFLIGFRSASFLWGVALQNIPLLLVIFIGGSLLMFQILRKLFKGDLGADLLAVIAIVTAVWLNEYLAATLVVLMLASGQLLEEYALHRASSVLHALAKRIPFNAHQRVNKTIKEISINEIQLGYEIVIYPHEASPVDGFVIEGHGFMDESYLTGEPYRVAKAPGSSVLSGSINGEKTLVIQAEKLPQDSRYAKIMQVMEEAEQSRPKIRRLGDQIGAIFAPLALIAASLAWYFTDDPLRFLSVLVIATPCPLLIAIPVTIISAISLSARKGIIIKDPIVLERLPTCKTAIFDKTGTLTYGQAELVEIIPFHDYTKPMILQFAASLERYSKHPLSTAIMQAAEKTQETLLEAAEVSEKPGQGLSGYLKGKKIQITSRKKLALNHPSQYNLLPPTKPGMECVILIEDHLAGLFYFRDTVRAEGQSFITHLKPFHHFTKVMIVSGDRDQEVEYLAKQLGIKDTFSNQTPEQKLEVVRKESSLAPTLFMGDGINDAPALTAATVGLAFGNQSSVTAQAAGAVILENSLTKVDELIHISELMRRIALQSSLGGMLLSIIGMYFAARGMITPVAGALIQEIIDIIAILNALRLTWQSEIKTL
jgi:heavy metal translocating P-type ATPase